MKNLTPITAVASITVFVALYILTEGQTVYLAPVFISLPFIYYLKKTGDKKETLNEVILNESPSVVSMMSTVLSAGGSLDSAIRYVAEKGPRKCAALFKKVVSEADCRLNPDLRGVFHSLISSVPPSLSSFRRAMYMVISASDSKEREEMERILKSATEVALEGLKQAGEEYSSKLQSPCMVIFGLGIMAPMILLSIVPMLNMGGSFGLTTSIPSGAMEFVILVIVPAVVALVMVTIRGKNPMVEYTDKTKGVYKLTPLVISIPVFILTYNMMELKYSIIISIVVGSVTTLAVLLPDFKKERIRREIESSMKDALFDLGNRLITGENFETALLSSMSVRKPCIPISEALSREYILCRGDIESAIKCCLSPYSPMMSDFISDVYRASIKDVRDAGRLAVALAHQLQDQDLVRKGIENKLRSMTDMMSGTAAVFAPLILGMSIAMMGPIAALSGDVNTEATFITVTVYLIELAFLMSMFSSMLSGRFRFVDVGFKFALVLPVASVILLICTGINL